MAATDPAIGEIKQVVTALATDALAGQISGLGKYLQPDTAKKLQPVLAMGQDVYDSYKIADKACQDKLGKPLMELYKGMGSSAGQVTMTIPEIPDAQSLQKSIDEQIIAARFRSLGEGDVLMFEPPAPPAPPGSSTQQPPPTATSFKKIDGKWLVGLAKEDLAKIDPVLQSGLPQRAADTVKGLLGDIATGVNGGNITADNYKAQFTAMVQQKLQPLLLEFMAMAMTQAQR